MIVLDNERTKSYGNLSYCRINVNFGEKKEKKTSDTEVIISSSIWDG